MRLDDILPRWTRYVTSESGGRDPLGLSRVSGRISDFLLKGIITTTDRARYYSFYCWALWHIQQEEQPKRSQQFVDALRRREAAFALASLMEESSEVVGIRAADKRFRSGQASGVFDSDFRVLPANPLGGYGQYYRGSLYQLGLTDAAQGMDFVIEGIAEELARAVQAELSPTPYLRKRLFTEKTISQTELKQSAQRLGVDAIRLPFAAKERGHLINLLFGFLESTSDNGATDESAHLRQHSLTQALHTVRQYEKAKLPLYYGRRLELELQLLYGPIYYNVLISDKGHTKAYQRPDRLSICHLYWRQFCLQQYLTLALEMLLAGVLETVADGAGGLTIGEIAERLTMPPFFKQLKQITGLPCKKPQALLHALDVKETPDDEACRIHQSRIGYDHACSEQSILGAMSSSAPEKAASACCALATLYAKWRGFGATDEAMYGVASMAGHEPWAGAVLPRLDAWLKPDATWKDCLETFLQEWVIQRHEIVRHEKRQQSDGGWLQIEQGRIVNLRDCRPATRSSRYDNVISILRDLNLLEKQASGQLRITTEGNHIVQKVLNDLL